MGEGSKDRAKRRQGDGECQIGIADCACLRQEASAGRDCACLPVGRDCGMRTAD